ncbi:MAG: ABC transporter ATP-binding protein [Hyphomicrobiaceae bacterium]
MKQSDYLSVSGASKKFGTATVLDGVDLTVARGEFVSLLGPSGCGKTTLLRLIAGLVSIDTGKIALDGRNLTKIPAHKRNIGMVLQNYALFPHLSVGENVGFGLRARGADKATIAETVAKSLDMVRMSAFSHRPVTSLSGGQQQRVAVARALAPRPDLLLLDEPFSALDRKLREHMEIELKHLLRELGITAVFVTHDQDEALVMSDRIAVMNRGVIEQFAGPASIYSRPATLFALEFVGSSTRLRGHVTARKGDTLSIMTVAGAVRAKASPAEGFVIGTPVTVAVRPEKIGLGPPPDDSANTVELAVTDMAYLGSKLQLHFRMQEGDVGLAEVNPSFAATTERGAKLAIHWPVTETLIFPAPVQGDV